MIPNNTKPKNRFLNYFLKNKTKILVFAIGLVMVVAGIISNFQNIRTQIARAGGIITYQDVSNINCSTSSITAGDSFNCTLTMFEDMSNYTGDLSIKINDGNTNYDFPCDGLPGSGFDLNCSITTDSNMIEGSHGIQYGNNDYGFNYGPYFDLYRNFDTGMISYIYCSEFGLIGTNRSCDIQLNVNNSSYISGDIYIRVGSSGSETNCGSASSLSSCYFDPGSQTGAYILEFSNGNGNWSSFGGDYIVRAGVTNNDISSVNCFQNVEVNYFTNCTVEMVNGDATLYEGSITIRSTPNSDEKVCTFPSTETRLYCTGVPTGNEIGTFQPKYYTTNTNGLDFIINTSNTITVSGITVTSITPSTITGTSGQNLTITGTNFVSGIYENLQSFGGTGNDSIRSMVVDSSGNKFIAGEFRGSITLGNTTLNSSGGSDIFLAKIDTSGNFVWAVKAGGGGNDGLSRKNGMTIAKDDGNLILTGYYQPIANIFGTNLFSAGGGNGDQAFFAKINSSNGNGIWARRLGNDNNIGIGNDDWPEQAGMAVDTDSSGNVYGSGILSIGDPGVDGYLEGFVVKYNSSGTQQWLKNLQGSEYTNMSNFTFWRQGRTTSLVVNGSDLYITGGFVNTVDFGNGITLTANNLQSGQGNIYVAKLNSGSGDATWARKIGSGSARYYAELPYGVALDSLGDVYVTGYVAPGASSAVFGGYTLNSITGSTFEDITFLTKLDPSGNFQWVKPLYGASTGTDTSRTMFIDSNDKIFIAGVQTGTTTDGTITVLGDQSNPFYAKYNTSGTLEEIKILGGANGALASIDNGSGGSQARAIALDQNGYLVVAGEYVGDLGIGANILTSAGGSDGFLVTYNPNNISVKIGATEVKGTVVNPTTVTLTTPTLSDGGYDITVTNFNGSFNYIPNGLDVNSNSPIQNSNISSISCTPTSSNINTTVNCIITTSVDLNTLSGSVNIRIGNAGSIVNCPVSGSGSILNCNNIPVGNSVGVFTSQYNASGSGSSYINGNNITVTTPATFTSIAPISGPVTGGTSVTLSGTGFTDQASVAQTSSGDGFSCALLSTGSVRCWGPNLTQYESNFGQLGYGDNLDKATPGGDVNIGGVATQISTGYYHTCALLSTGNVKCWGYNDWGQLGYGDTTNRNSPGSNINVGGTVIKISAGAHHTCALLSTGNVKCWGLNNNGQLGYGDNTNRNTPGNNLNVGGTVTNVYTGSNRTCVLLTTGNIKCWGYNPYGELGYGDIINRNSPGDDINVGGTVTQVTMGVNTTCALLSTGNVKCWGYNNYSLLGYGDTAVRTSPAGDVNLGGTVTQISGGAIYTCALLSTGNVKCWGYDNSGGGITFRNNPGGDVNLGGSVTQISAGYNYACAVLSTNNVRCWDGTDGTGYSKETYDSYAVPFPNPLFVTFDGLSATSVILVNSTTITGVTPAHAAGFVNVALTNGDGTSHSLTNGYEYIANNTGNCSTSSSSSTPGQTVVDLCVDGGTLTLYAGDSNKNNDICTTVDITAGNVVDTTISGQSATSVTCSTAENSIALTGVTVDSKRQFATAIIDDIIFEDLRGLVTSNYSVTATVSNFVDPNDNNKRIDLGSNPDSVSNETDQDKPQTSNDQNKIFGVLDASSGSITPLRSAITIAEGTSNYTRGSRITLIDNITQATLLSTSTPVKPGRIALDNVLFKLRIPSLVSAGNFQGTIVQTVI